MADLDVNKRDALAEPSWHQLLFVGLDDTDTREIRSTSNLARRAAAALPVDYQVHDVIRSSTTARPARPLHRKE